MKCDLIVLKRIRAGDEDILAKAYGQPGLVTIYIKNGFTINNPLYAAFEPFNIVTAETFEKGEILIPSDLISIQPFSLLCSDYKRFLWMCDVALFILKNVRFYDKELFNMFVNYMITDTKGSDNIYRLKLRLDFIKKSGLRPKFLDTDYEYEKDHTCLRLSNGSLSSSGDIEVDRGVILTLRSIYHENIDSKRFSISGKVFSKAMSLLEAFIEFHTR